MLPARLYEDREPQLVMRVRGKPRLFVIYEQSVIDEVVTDIKRGCTLAEVYRELCEHALAGDSRLAALPKDSPPWYRTRDGRWRPLEIDPKEQTDG